MTAEHIARARQSLQGYVDNGPRYWAGAVGFTLVSLGDNGESDGGGADICRACVSDVAAAALSDMEEIAEGVWPAHSLATALGVCGPAVAYEITGVDKFEFDSWCAECGRFIPGNEVSQLWH